MTNQADAQYINLCKKILENGTKKDDRTGTGTLSVFGHQMRFDLSKGFPLLTTKKLNWNSIAHELLWFISGNTNIKYLNDNNVNIWNEWADKNGDLGSVYGEQWRSWWHAGSVFNLEGIDQIATVIEQIKINPNSRRLIVSAWNVGELDDMALPPCHLLFQFYVADGKLSCQLYQRSADVFLGLPFNIASYSLLTHMIAHITNLKVGEFIHTIGDAHIYTNHIKQINKQIKRKPKELPNIKFKRDITDIDDFTFDDIELIGYKPHPHIKGKVSV